MRVNRVTGERFQDGSIGSKLVLTSISTGLIRVMSNSRETRIIFRKVKSRLPIRVRSRKEEEYLPDLVRSLQLEVNYLKRKGELAHLKF